MNAIYDNVSRPRWADFNPYCCFECKCKFFPTKESDSVFWCHAHKNIHKCGQATLSASYQGYACPVNYNPDDFTITCAMTNYVLEKDVHPEDAAACFYKASALPKPDEKYIQVKGQAIDNPLEILDDFTVSSWLKQKRNSVTFERVDRHWLKPYLKVYKVCTSHRLMIYQAMTYLWKAKSLKAVMVFCQKKKENISQAFAAAVQHYFSSDKKIATKYSPTAGYRPKHELFTHFKMILHVICPYKGGKRKHKDVPAPNTIKAKGGQWFMRNATINKSHDGSK